MVPQPMSRSDFPTEGSHPDLTSILEQHLRDGFQPDLALDLILNELVIRVAEATHASSAALALVRGDQLVCRAATGNFAPDLGVPLNPREGLSGVCQRTREPQISVDTEVDPRVAVSFARRFGIRSVLAVPVFEHLDRSHFAGVLEVFSPTPSAFSHAEQRTLEGFAEECARVRHAAVELGQSGKVVEMPKLESAGPAIAMPVPAEPLVMPALPRILPVPDVPTEAADRAAIPEVDLRSFRDAEPATFKSEPNFVSEPNVASESNVVSEPNFDFEPVAPEIMTPQPALPEFEPVSAPVPRAGYDGWSLALGTLAIIAIIAVSFLIGSRIGWLRATVSPSHISQTATENPEATTAEPATAEAQPAESTTAKTSTIKPKPKLPRKEVRAATEEKSAAPGAGELVVYEKGKVVFRMKNPPGAASPQAYTESVNAANKTEDKTDVNASLAASATPVAPASSASGTTTSTTVTTTASSQSVWLEPAEAEDRLISRIEPAYPLAARRAHRAGEVVLEVDVAEDGSVSSVRTLKGDPILAAAAREAVRTWRYQPYRLHDQPSRFHTDVTLSFALSN